MYEVSKRKRAKFQGCPNCPRPQVGFWEFGIGTTPHKKIYLICHTCGWQTKPTRASKGSKGMWKQYEKVWIKRRKNEAIKHCGMQGVHAQHQDKERKSKWFILFTKWKKD